MSGKIQSRRVRFDGGGGYQLAGIVDAPNTVSDAVPAGSPNVPISGHLVLAHCFTCSKDLKAMVRLSRAIATAGLTVLRFDMTGLGDSEGRFGDTTFDTNVADLIAAGRWAAEQLGGPAVWMGHSLGGAAVLKVAGRGGADPMPHAVVTLAAPSDTRHLVATLQRLNPELHHQRPADVVIGGRTFSITDAMLDALRDNSLPDAISNIRRPILAFHSPDDRTVSIDHAIRIETLQRNAGGNVSLITLDGADHLLTRQPRDIDLVAEITVAFARRWLSEIE